MTTMAKCGIYKYSFCTHKHDAPECKKCTLINRRDGLYKWVNGKKYKRCPHCEQYKLMNEFKPNSQGNISWCNDCKRQYSKDVYHKDHKHFMLAHKVDNKKVYIKFDSTFNLLKFVRKRLEEGETSIEIKRI